MNELLTHIVIGNMTEEMFRAVTDNYTELSTLLWPKAELLLNFNIVYSGSSMHIKLIKRGEVHPLVAIYPIMAGKGSGSYTVQLHMNSPF